MNNRPYFGGFFTCENMQTYKKNGVTVHKPPFGNEFWGRTAHMVFADFVDADSGEITDQFYGSCNDFNISFLAKAALGARFDVIVHEFNDSPKVNIPYDYDGKRMGYIGTAIGTLEQMDDHSWAPADRYGMAQTG